MVPTPSSQLALNSQPVSELRLVLTVEDFDAALRLYRDGLGLREVPAVASPNGRVAILEAGRATLELGDQTHAAWIDDVEVGHRTAGTVRIALAVDDIDAVSARVVELGNDQLAGPTPTPFGSRNARFSGVAGVQLTLFSVAASADDDHDQS